MRNARMAIWLAITLLAGCMPVPAGLVGQSGNATLAVQLRVTSGAFATQAVVTPYTAADIHHVLVRLQRLDANVEHMVLDANQNPVQKDLPVADLGQPIVFAHLKANATYRIRAYAYRAAGTAPSDLISTTDANSYREVTLTSDDLPAIATLPVRLIDTLFSGQATASGISVTDGQYLDGPPAWVETAYWVDTLAGSPGLLGSTDGVGSAARFEEPYGLTLDSHGNLYLADSVSCTIRKITASGIVTTLAGSPRQVGSADGTGAAARFQYPMGLTADALGNLYVADSSNFTIRKINPAGVVSTVAGSPGQMGFADGTGSAARFFLPTDLAVDASGSLYVADMGNDSIRQISPEGVVTTLAGRPYAGGSKDGTGLGAGFNGPTGIAIDHAGNLYVVDTFSHILRKVTPDGVVTTLAGSNGQSGSTDGVGSDARLNVPRAIDIDLAGNLYVSDSANELLRKVSPAGVVTTVAGTVANFGYADGLGWEARFHFPFGIAVDPTGVIYVADSYNFVVRRVR